MLTIPTLVLPHYAGPEELLTAPLAGDAGRDLYCAEDVVLAPGQRTVVPTGIAVALPESDLELQIRPRSGHSAKLGLVVLNSPGTVDSGYRGEIGVILFNSSPAFPLHVAEVLAQVVEGVSPPARLLNEMELWREKSTIRLPRGSRIAQAVVSRFVAVRGSRVDALPPSDRGADGFGSTGVR